MKVNNSYLSGQYEDLSNSCCISADPPDGVVLGIGSLYRTLSHVYSAVILVAQDKIITSPVSNSASAPSLGRTQTAESLICVRSKLLETDRQIR